MPYIHVKVDDNSPAKVTLFRLDGWQNMMINGEKYIEVSPGNHVVELYGPNTNYVCRGKLNENDVFEVVAMLGLESLVHNANPFSTVVFEPEYYIKTLTANEIMKLKEIVDTEQRQEQARQEREDAHGTAISQLIFSIFSLSIALSGFVATIEFAGTSESILYALVAVVLFPLGAFLMKKAIKNFKK